MEQNNKKDNNPEKKSFGAKRILALIGVVVVIAVYMVGLVFAFTGRGYALSVVMSCFLLATYIAVYFHFGQLMVNLIKKKKNPSEKENKDE